MNTREGDIRHKLKQIENDLQLAKMHLTQKETEEVDRKRSCDHGLDAFEERIKSRYFLYIYYFFNLSNRKA